MLIERLKVVSCGSMPCVSSDTLPHYPNAPLHGYGIPESLIRTPGKRGRKPTPNLSGALVMVPGAIEKQVEQLLGVCFDGGFGLAQDALDQHGAHHLVQKKGQTPTV